MKQVICSLGILLLIFSCTKEETEDIQIDFGYEYFPLNIGQTWFYQADSIVFDPQADGIQIDSTRFRIRERITDTIRDNVGNLVYRIEYAEQHTGQSNWMVKNIYKVYLEDNRAIRSENNLDFIKLIFPIKAQSSWNATAFIDERTRITVAGEPVEIFKGWSSLITTKEGQLDIGGEMFDEVLEVELANSENILELRQVTERYVKGKGLAYQEFIILDTQCEYCCNNDLGACQTVNWIDKAERGFILRKYLE